ncbi:MAG TPA: 16S rRNA (adenine(1518)-N(6)/adenine(1519)-N(6))-dimethyltransferase RsmA, partial [Actinomycetota bacterium]|nr:16S rRNA (adenine(1518)-N(6)/adenine(1519)-N(6))-dimethyltransferase RsmA [Actinomycetota bacterium]
TRGQNFVIDPNTIRRIVELAEVADEDSVLEVGPGIGSLTVALAARAGRVTAVEIDPRLVGALREVVGDRVEIVEADAMRIELGAVEATKLVANLPYNIAAPLVIKVLTEAPQISELTVMTQREVGERLAAGPGSRTYGQPSVMVALFADARVVARVPRTVFWPVPNVDSVVVRVVRRTAPFDADLTAVARIVSAAFSQRRKMLRSSLTEFAPDDVERSLAEVGVAPTARPEVLTASDFVAFVGRLMDCPSSQRGSS